MPISDHLCETCGAPAVGASRDIKELHPVQDDRGYWWAAWAPAGDWHFWCKKHERRSETIRLPPGSYNITQPPGLPPSVERAADRAVRKDR